MAKNIRIEACGLTDVGLKRENNQDHFLINHDLGLFVVADGMGGHQGGEVASLIAVESIEGVIRKTLQGSAKVDPYELLQRAYAVASQNIYDKSESTPQLKGMGTTAITGFFFQKKLYLANVGDSRAYMIHPPHLWQLSEDHSLLNEQIRAGLVRPDQAVLASTRNVITRSVGFERQVVCDVIERSVEEGDCFLICSDGLTGQVTDRRICDVCLTLPFQNVPSRLVEEAKRNGGDDNITVVFMQAVAAN